SSVSLDAKEQPQSSVIIVVIAVIVVVIIVVIVVVHLMLRSSLSLQPESTDAMYCQGIALKELGQTEKARARLGWVLLKDPRHKMAKVALAAIMAEKPGELGEGIENTGRLAFDCRRNKKRNWTCSSKDQADGFAGFDPLIQRVMQMAQDFLRSLAEDMSGLFQAPNYVSREMTLAGAIDADIRAEVLPVTVDIFQNSSSGLAFVPEFMEMLRDMPAPLSQV
ncbi:unnamed protein product, partial [Polarella glacialis]